MVLLINPPTLFFKTEAGAALFQPLGLAYIAAVLRENRYPVSILDAAAEGWQNFHEFDKSRNFIGLGFAKLLTCGGLGIWTIADWFFIMDATRARNLARLHPYLV